MRKTRLKILYQDLEGLNLPEVEYMQNKNTGQIVLSRNCKRFYRQLAKNMWRHDRSLLRIDPAVKEHLETAVNKHPTPTV